MFAEMHLVYYIGCVRTGRCSWSALSQRRRKAGAEYAAPQPSATGVLGERGQFENDRASPGTEKKRNEGETGAKLMGQMELLEASTNLTRTHSTCILRSELTVS
jgi:hypothetical protein